jgi:hypothetical protein
MIELDTHEDLATKVGSGGIGSWWFYGDEYRRWWWSRRW